MFNLLELYIFSSGILQHKLKTQRTDLNASYYHLNLAVILNFPIVDNVWLSSASLRLLESGTVQGIQKKKKKKRTQKVRGNIISESEQVRDGD